VTNLDDGVVQLLAGAGKIQQALRGGAAQHGLAFTSHYLIAAVHEWPLRVASNFSIRPVAVIRYLGGSPAGNRVEQSYGTTTHGQHVALQTLKKSCSWLTVKPCQLALLHITT
jgi:hypothetical protein